jgi:hypothetical protein
MTKDNAKLLLPIIEAYSRGETIQIMQEGGCWKDIELSCLDFNSDPKYYRVKPRWLAVRKGSFNFENNPDVVDSFMGVPVSRIDRNNWDLFIEEQT